MLRYKDNHFLEKTTSGLELRSGKKRNGEKSCTGNFVADCKGNPLVCLQGIEVSSIDFLVVETKCRHIFALRLLLAFP